MSIETLSVKNEKELEQILVNDISAVEKGLTVIGSQIPINAVTKVDILCHDENGGLVIFKLSTEEDDSMLFEGLKALKHLDNMKHMIKFYYQNYKINDAETPRLILFAPSFSKTMLAITQHISGVRIDLYEWEYLKFADQKALRIKPAFLSTQTAGKAQERKPEAVRKKEPAPERFMPITPREPTPAPVPTTAPEPRFTPTPAPAPVQEKKEEQKKEEQKKKSLLRF